MVKIKLNKIELFASLGNSSQKPVCLTEENNNQKPFIPQKILLQLTKP